MKPRIVLVREKEIAERTPPDEDGWTVLETGGQQNLQDIYNASYKPDKNAGENEPRQAANIEAAIADAQKLTSAGQMQTPQVKDAAAAAPNLPKYPAAIQPDAPAPGKGKGLEAEKLKKVRIVDRIRLFLGWR